MHAWHPARLARQPRALPRLPVAHRRARRRQGRLQVRIFVFQKPVLKHAAPLAVPAAAGKASTVVLSMAGKEKLVVGRQCA